MTTTRETKRLYILSAMRAKATPKDRLITEYVDYHVQELNERIHELEQHVINLGAEIKRLRILGRK